MTATAVLAGLVRGLDHALVAVRDLDAARADYERLGFTCTPRGRHPGRGTANHCIMFADDYVELIGAAPGETPSGALGAFLDAGEGLRALAFATDDAAGAAAALNAAGIAAEGPSELARELLTDDGTLTPRFALVHLPPAATPAVPAFLCQHLTPELMRRPAWLAHANTAQGVAAVTAVVDDPFALAQPYARLFGEAAVFRTDTILGVRVGALTLVFTHADEIDLLYGSTFAPADRAPPYLAAMTIRVADLAAAVRVLETGGVAFTGDRENDIVVAPADAHGVILEFTREARPYA